MVPKTLVVLEGAECVEDEQFIGEGQGGGTCLAVFTELNPFVFLRVFLFLYYVYLDQ